MINYSHYSFTLIRPQMLVNEDSIDGRDFCGGI